MLHQTKTVGVAERLLVGAHAKVPPARGAWEPVVHEGCVIGAAVRTRPDAKIVYVSPGWGCELEEAIDLVMAATVRYRWPEPLRYARMQLKTAIRRRLELHKHA
jgi:deoxyribonuclease V